MIKILHVVRELGSGGIESVICNLYKNIDRDRICFDFVMHWSGEEGMHEAELRSMGSKIFVFKTLKECGSIRVYNSQWEKFWEEHKDAYQIIHSHYMSHDGLILEMAKRYSKVTIAHSHCTNNPKFHLTDLYRAYINRNMHKYIDYMFACSYMAGKDFFGNSFDKRDGIVLKNAIEIDCFKYNKEIRSKVRKEYKIDDFFVIGHVANYSSEHKNQDFMLRTFAQLTKQRDDVYLVWIGYISERDLVHIRELLKELKIENRVLLLGRQKNVYEWMQAFDVFFFPSKFEGLGVVLIEAQVAGLKCVTSDQIPEEAIISDSVCVCKITDDCNEWAETINRNLLYERKDGIEIVKRAGYDVKDTALYMESFYLSIIKD